jgi:prevent-host-death family protein
MMKTALAADVGANLDRYLEQCRTEGPIVITQDGKAVAVLLAPRDEEDLERLVLGHSPRFQAVLEQSRQSIADGKGLSRDEFWQAVEQQSKDKHDPTTS